MKATFVKASGSEEQEHGSQSAEDAACAFYGIDPQKRGADLGNPIPGYSGVNQRVEADNVFGMTYAEARRRAKDSLNRINVEKGETLKQTSEFLPAYKRTKATDFY